MYAFVRVSNSAFGDTGAITALYLTNKKEMKLPKEFNEYYNNLTVAKPAIIAFLKMDIRFTLGLYHDYFSSRGITVDVSTIGYLIRKYPTTELQTNIIQEVVFEGEIDIILAHSRAIQGTLEYLENPF